VSYAFIVYAVISRHWLSHKLKLVKYPSNQTLKGSRCLLGNCFIFLLLLRFVWTAVQLMLIVLQVCVNTHHILMMLQSATLLSLYDLFLLPMFDSTINFVNVFYVCCSVHSRSFVISNNFLCQSLLIVYKRDIKSFDVNQFKRMIDKCQCTVCNDLWSFSVLVK